MEEQKKIRKMKNVCEKENQIADIFVSLSKCREKIKI